MYPLDPKLGSDGVVLRSPSVHEVQFVVGRGSSREGDFGSGVRDIPARELCRRLKSPRVWAQRDGTHEGSVTGVVTRVVHEL